MVELSHLIKDDEEDFDLRQGLMVLKRRTVTLLGVTEIATSALDQVQQRLTQDLEG